MAHFYEIIFLHHYMDVTRQSILLLYYYISHYTNVYRKLEHCL